MALSAAQDFPSIAGLSLSGASGDEHRVVVGEGCDAAEFERLLCWLPRDCELTFYDQHYPGTRGDPGAWVDVQRRDDQWRYRLGNHGWSSGWMAQSAAALAAWMALNVQAHPQVREPLRELRLRDGAEPAFGRPRDADGVPGLKLRRYEHLRDEAAVVALWQRCGLTRPWNDPSKDIRRKLVLQPEGFVVGEMDGALVATAMAGYDGHRGWVNYLAVDPDRQRAGIGRAMMAEAERILRWMHCPKINVQVRSGNAAALAFYARIGFVADDAASLGKRLEQD